MKSSERQKLLDDLRRNVRQGCPWHFTFAPHRSKLTQAERDNLEAWLKKNFELWAESWILPAIDEIEQRWLKNQSLRESNNAHHIPSRSPTRRRYPPSAGAH